MARSAAMPSAITAAAALLIGVLLVQWSPVLPPRWCAPLLALLALAPAWHFPRTRGLACLLLGVSWALWRGAQAMEARLPRAMEGRDFSVVGHLVELPLARTDATRFIMQVEQAVSMASRCRCRVGSRCPGIRTRRR